jgi:hypothetical protein
MDPRGRKPWHVQKIDVYFSSHSQAGLGLFIKTFENEAKKTPAQGGRKVIEAGFIQARNLSSSDIFIRVCLLPSKLKV